MESSWGCNGRIERIESDGVDTSYEQHLQSGGRDCDSWVGSVIKSKISKTGCYSTGDCIQSFLKKAYFFVCEIF